MPAAGFCMMLFVVIAAAHIAPDLWPCGMWKVAVSCCSGLIEMVHNVSLRSLRRDFSHSTFLFYSLIPAALMPHAESSESLGEINSWQHVLWKLWCHTGRVEISRVRANMQQPHEYTRSKMCHRSWYNSILNVSKVKPPSLPKHPSQLCTRSWILNVEAHVLTVQKHQQQHEHVFTSRCVPVVVTDKVKIQFSPQMTAVSDQHQSEVPGEGLLRNTTSY